MEQDAICFVYETGRGEPRWRCGNGDWVEMDSDQAKVLAHVLNQPGIERAALRNSVITSESSDPKALFRKVLERLSEQGARLTGRPELKILSSGTKTLSPTGEAAIFGAVDLTALRSR